jgi:hypothetical protein
VRILAIALFATGFPALFGQSPPAVPGCEPRPEVRRILDEKLSEEALQQMKFTERVALRRQVLEELIAQYPREVEPYRRLIRATREDDPDQYAALMDRFQKEAGQHPDDPLALYVAGLALRGKNTAEHPTAGTGAGAGQGFCLAGAGTGDDLLSGRQAGG